MGQKYMGIDLAWKCNNHGCHKTGIAIVEAVDGSLPRIITTLLATDNNDIIAKWDEHKPKFISIDAPLIVINETGRRQCESQLNSHFQQKHAGAYPSNTTFLKKTYYGIRGEEIVKLFRERGFVHYPDRASDNTVQWIAEVYPHSASVVLFELPIIIKYKKGKVADRRIGLSTYRNLILTLFSQNELHNQIATQNIHDLKGLQLKNMEDKLDAILCAYIAFLMHTAPDSVTTYGDSTNGYIVTPTP